MTNTPRANGTTTDPRDQKAAALLAAGAVRLNFDGTATVKGSGKAVYTVRKDADGVAHCDCPDNYRRGAVCKHLRAVKALCGLARACREQAKETGRVRLPYLLALALRGEAIPSPVVIEAAPTCQDCGTTISRGRHCLDCLDRDLGFPVAA